MERVMTKNTRVHSKLSPVMEEIRGVEGIIQEWLKTTRAQTQSREYQPSETGMLSDTRCIEQQMKKLRAEISDYVPLPKVDRTHEFPTLG